MNFNYNELFRKQLYTLQNKLGISDFHFEVDEEQAFIKRKDLEPNTIYVLTKTLQNEIQIGIDSQPIQVLILSEQNSLDVAKEFFSQYAKTYNWKAENYSYTKDNKTHYIYVKQQYSDPVVLSNFNTVAFGYRSVLYMSVNLYIMNDVVDLHDLYIDNEKVKALTFNVAYSMSTNSQQIDSNTEFIAKSVKSVSSLAITLSIPVVDSPLITKVFAILNETDVQTEEFNSSFGGNENFEFDFYLGTTHFINKTMKLINAELGAAINNIPTINLGFMK